MIPAGQTVGRALGAFAGEALDKGAAVVAKNPGKAAGAAGAGITLAALAEAAQSPNPVEVAVQLLQRDGRNDAITLLQQAPNKEELARKIIEEYRSRMLNSPEAVQETVNG